MPFTVGQYLTANDLKSQEDAHTLGYGVVNGLKVIPTGPPDMDIHVEIGKAYVADTLVEKGAVTDLTVTGADPTNPRKDIVVCNSAGTLSIVAGTPEAALPNGNVGVYTLNPEPPSIPANSIILGEIWVPAGATEITGSEIYDKRVSIADFLTHKADAAAHHDKYTNAEAQAIADARIVIHAALEAAHHARYTDAEAQAIADALIATHAALATVHQDTPALIAAHAGIAAAHHDKYTNAEAQAIADARIVIHAAIAAAHHARYTDAEAAAQADAKVATHSALDTGVHGVGASTVCSETEALAIALSAPGYPQKLKPNVERWVMPGWAFLNLGSGGQTVGLICYTPIFVEETTTYIRIGIVVQAARAASSVDLRIFEWNNGLPGALILSAGTVDSSTIGSKEITIAQELTRGHYFLAHRCIGDAAPLGYPTTPWRIPVSGIGLTLNESKSKMVLTVTAEYADPAPAPTGVDERSKACVMLRGN